MDREIMKLAVVQKLLNVKQDALLEKISTKGMDALTEKEKARLEELSH